MPVVSDDHVAPLALEANAPITISFIAVVVILVVPVVPDAFCLKVGVSIPPYPELSQP